MSVFVHFLSLYYLSIHSVIEKTQKSISDSISGKKPLPDEKIESLKRRLEMYQKRMDELSRTLNDEVR
jgi:chaperonin cofactor prefoldin